MRENEPSDAYHPTGLTRGRILDLCTLVHNVALGQSRSWPPILGLFDSVVVALTYLRGNRVHVELAETYGFSQPTSSRAITAVTPLLGVVLEPLRADRGGGGRPAQYVVHGTLLPCWLWAEHPELYSGKHKTAGVNVQVVCTLSDRLVWISDPADGSPHGTHCLRESHAVLLATALHRCHTAA